MICETIENLPFEKINDTNKYCDMSNIDDLKNTTSKFFNIFWNPLNGQPPKWSKKPWVFNSTIPNHEKGGCYALIENEDVVYIGVGISKGTEKYKDHGLGFRLKKYWKLNKNSDSPNKYCQSKGWQNITGIMTIGFEQEYSPLAAALEIYLIRKLKPKKNFLHK